jgi:hypothetical protein
MFNDRLWPLMADSRSLGSGFQRLLTRKLPLKPAESAAKSDPKQPLGKFRFVKAEHFF